MVCSSERATARAENVCGGTAAVDACGVCGGNGICGVQSGGDGDDGGGGGGGGGGGTGTFIWGLVVGLLVGVGGPKLIPLLSSKQGKDRQGMTVPMQSDG